MTATASKVTVTVTQEHIDQGRPGDCARCPIALAILAALPEASHAEVFFEGDDLGEEHPFASAWLPDERVLHFALPVECSLFVAAFDNGEVASPFSFEAEVLS